MNAQNIQQVVRDLFRQNYKLYPESYADSVVEAVTTAKEVAKGYWDNRTEEEEQRDAEAQVTLQDYENWCVQELTELKKEAINH
jgi:hypothetical protein